MVPPAPIIPTVANQQQAASEARLVIALDYGTTYTGTSICLRSNMRREDTLDLDNVRVVTRWAKEETLKVPSRYSYSPSPKGCTQWGHDIDDNSRIMAWTKLELEQTKTRTQELGILCELFYGVALMDFSEEAIINNDIPRHLAKEAEDIVRDYLDEIAETTSEDIISSLGHHVPDRIPVDLIVTHPAKWSDSAMNSTYRAVAAAFNTSRFPKLRSISFVSEPEACAHFTLRAAQNKDRGRLKRNDCFVVVDAGGGTVDLASFQVISVDSSTEQFRLAPVGYITGDKCGATFIDKSFEDFLEQRLGKEDWKKLKKEGSRDAGAGGHTLMNDKMRQLHKQFEAIKHEFKGDSALAKTITLPTGIGTIDNEEMGIVNGTIRITADDLKQMFKASVDRTLILVAGQITQIELSKKRVRNIFLSGGFASSEYLYRRMVQFGQTRHINVERGGDCWTAVAKGAVLKGLGICSEKPQPVKGCPRHYGVKTRTHFAPYQHKLSETEMDPEGVQWATDQIRWLVQKGDVIHPGKPTQATYECHWSMKASTYSSGKGRGRDPITGYTPSTEVTRDVVFVASARDEVPARYAEIEKVVSLRCDLTEVPDHMTATYQNKQSGKYMKFWVTVTVSVSDKVRIKITSGGKELASTNLPL
ncbi:hypothetical protein GE09DRAFT_1166380 [Coniochaeta sp. 2T2.1]|nr:hypothetical protein GE09DRAFT_1166380 [Coniochaeta sp. 2T2.1]